MPIKIPKRHTMGPMLSVPSANSAVPGASEDIKIILENIESMIPV